MEAYKNRHARNVSIVRSHDSAMAYHEHIEKDKRIVRGDAYAMLHAMEIQSTPKNIATTLRTPKDLGLKGKSTYDEIVSAAENNNFVLCPGWAAIEYYFKPTDDLTRFRETSTVCVAMKPIPGFDGDLRVFCIYVDGLNYGGYGMYVLTGVKTSSPGFMDTMPWLLALPD